jgi:hypothetical protein
MLLISWSVELWKIYISSLCVIVDSIYFDLQFPPLAPKIIKEQCSYYTSSYSFHFRHLSFNGIKKEAISS